MTAKISTPTIAPTIWYHIKYRSVEMFVRFIFGNLYPLKENRGIVNLKQIALILKQNHGK